MREVETSETGKNRIKGMIEIRDCVKNLLEMQTNDYPDYDIEKEQHRLNEIYDKFVKKYGYITVEVTQPPFPMTAHISLSVLLKYSKMMNLNARRIYSQNEPFNRILLKPTQIPPLRLTVSQ